MRVLVVLIVMLVPATQVWSQSIGKAYALSKKYPVGERHMQVRLLGTLVLNKTEVNGFGPREMSGLAWDEDAQLLYAVSDDGHLCHFAPQFVDGVLTAVDFVAAYPLREADGTLVRGKASDSESLAARNTHNGISGDTELLISFEIQPRLLSYTVDGHLRAELPLSPALADISNYAGENKGLEAIALHEEYGLLMAPERPLNGANQNVLSIYSAAQHVWQMVPIDTEHSAVVGLEVTPHGDLLVLERRYSSVFSPVIWSVRRLQLNPETAGQPQTADEILTMTTAGSAWSPDNFEGIAHHRNNKYFIISDDNESSLQRTLLSYFEILEFDRFLQR